MLILILLNLFVYCSSETVNISPRSIKEIVDAVSSSLVCNSECPDPICNNVCPDPVCNSVCPDPICNVDCPPNVCPDPVCPQPSCPQPVCPQPVCPDVSGMISDIEKLQSELGAAYLLLDEIFVDLGVDSVTAESTPWTHLGHIIEHLIDNNCLNEACRDCGFLCTEPGVDVLTILGFEDSICYMERINFHCFRD